MKAALLLPIFVVACSMTEPVGERAQQREAALLTGGASFVTGPANVWIGLANSDDVGLRLDLLAEMLIDGQVVASSETDDIAGGSSGFNNALLRTLTFADPPVAVADGSVLGFRVSARRTCTGAGHASGTARLWYDGASVDSGAARDAGSRVETTLDGVGTTRYLRPNAVLGTTAGVARTYIDVKVNSTVACPARPFTAFATWEDTPRALSCTTVSNKDGVNQPYPWTGTTPMTVQRLPNRVQTINNPDGTVATQVQGKLRLTSYVFNPQLGLNGNGTLDLATPSGPACDPAGNCPSWDTSGAASYTGIATRYADSPSPSTPVVVTGTVVGRTFTLGRFFIYGTYGHSRIDMTHYTPRVVYSEYCGVPPASSTQIF